MTACGLILKGCIQKWYRVPVLSTISDTMLENELTSILIDDYDLAVGVHDLPLRLHINSAHLKQEAYSTSTFLSDAYCGCSLAGPKRFCLYSVLYRGHTNLI